MELCLPTIPCLVLDRQSIPNHLQEERARRKNRARYPLPTRESEQHDDHRAAAVHHEYEVPALAYGRDGPDHAGYWCCHGRIDLRLPSLVSIHRPLGILILILVVIRFVNRRFSTLPPFPASMSSQERFVASASELLLYTLLFVQPLVGWGMLSAASYPITMYGSIHLFPILPHNVTLYAMLRRFHTVLAYLLFLTFLAHLGAVLFHTWVVRDGTFSRMAPWKVRAH